VRQRTSSLVDRVVFPVPDVESNMGTGIIPARVRSTAFPCHLSIPVRFSYSLEPFLPVFFTDSLVGSI